MPAMLSAALVLLAQAPAVAPSVDAPATQAADESRPPADACPSRNSTSDGTAIVICTQRPQGYRLNPDVMEAKREMRSGGRPNRPNGAPRPDCATVGPQPCMNAGINLIAAALTAAEMAKRVAEGKEIGSMFLTDPHPDEYHLYLMAKARREAEDAEKSAAAKAKARAESNKPVEQPSPPPANN